MISEYKIKIVEGEKSVKQEIELRGDNKEEIVKECKELYGLLEPFCKSESIKKLGVR